MLDAQRAANAPARAPAINAHIPAIHPAAGPGAIAVRPKSAALLAAATASASPGNRPRTRRGVLARGHELRLRRKRRTRCLDLEGRL